MDLYENIQWRLIVTESGTLDVPLGDTLITEIATNGKRLKDGSRSKNRPKGSSGRK